LSVAKLTHAIEFAFEAPLAQHALSPANALDAVSIAARTRAEVVILIMVTAQTCAIQGPFNLFSSMIPYLSFQAQNGKADGQRAPSFNCLVEMPRYNQGTDGWEIVPA
jgi:hypothetical protein